MEQSQKNGAEDIWKCNIFQHNLVPRNLDKVEDYVFAINQVQLAATGFVRAMGANAFFTEACQCLINAINLFQKGFFDAAFYMLRQSVEISIGSLFLVSNKNKMKQWKNLERGFEKGRMVDWLIKNEGTFEEMKILMASFFSKIREDELLMNKYIHKQGFQSFYTVLRNKEQKNEWLGKTKSDFEHILRDCIGAVAVYRLCLDAFPVALSDEDLAFRAPDLLPEAFSIDFLEEYIGEEAVNGYKQTQIYKDTVAWLLAQPKQNEAVYMLVHYQCVERCKEKYYLEQWDILDFYDRLAVRLFLKSIKVSRLYINGIFEYTSEMKSNNSDFVCGGSYYKELFADSSSDFNFKYKNAFLSRIKVGKNYVYLEHNEKMNFSEVDNIMSYAVKLSEEYKAILELDFEM